MGRQNRMMQLGIWWWMALVWVGIQIYGCGGCWEQERFALLQLKTSINYPNGTSLPSWEDTESDCCHWERVVCNITTQRVIKLFLNSTRGYYGLENWYFNASLFLTFKELRELDLSRNRLAGWVTNEGFDRLVGLEKLQILNLDSNRYNNSILPYLGVLSSLKTLSIYYNRLNGSIHFQDLCAMSNLEELDLSDNWMTHLMTTKGTKCLNKLRVLSLDWNNFNNSILPYLGVLSSLKTLHIAGNKLNGSIHFQDLCAMSNLEELDLSYNWEINHLMTTKGTKCLNKLSFLRLNGEIFNSSVLQSLEAFPSLKNLSLQIQGLVTAKDLGALNNLEHLNLDYSSINGGFLQNVGVINSLRVLSLRMCGLSGSLPSQGWCNLKNLELLDLSENDFKGILPSCLGNLTSLRILDLSFNHFKGNVSLSSLVSLEYISLSHNHFMLPFSCASFCHLSKLKVILSDNITVSVENEFQSWVPRFQLKVVFPTKKMSYVYNGNLLDLMSGVDFSCNQLTGEIPIEIGNLNEIRALNLSHNCLIGSIPSTFSNLRNVESLDLSYNNLNGSIPSQLTVLNSLAVFSVAYNNLSGKIPDMKAQFSTFDEKCYEGNPYLCGPPLQNHCANTKLPSPMQNGSNKEDNDEESPAPYYKHQTSENDHDFITPNGTTWYPTRGRNCDIGDVPNQPAWSCFVKEDPRESLSLLSEESCSSSAGAEKQASSNCKLWTEDPFGACPVPDLHVNARSSFEISKHDVPAECSPVSEKLAFCQQLSHVNSYETPIFSNTGSQQTKPNLSPDSNMKGRPQESFHIAGLGGDDEFPNISVQESVRKNEENKLKSQPTDPGKFEPQLDICNERNGLSSENGKSMYALDSEGNCSDFKEAKDKIEEMERLKAMCSLEYAEETSSSVKIPEELENSFDEKEYVRQDEIISSSQCQF
ncbi:hypothetical protein F0562_030220 [Nyssa sinensis]|uniref:Leucine-rich repeat-containing N-terminal plant-type domain-containing protein n=1 Tax=Nyssa sinensis TaxID=561372 RepID=A0A5J5B0D0_9ASTE|nr:hypothetical protein F0562_030220 [Nyssa sinensis]